MKSNLMSKSGFLLVFIITLVFVFSGCVSTGFLMAKPEVTMFGNTYPPKNDDESIDVFRTNIPNQEYIEIAQIKCGDSEDSWNMQQILNEARKIGADGVIITGRTGSWGAESYGIYASESYGITAIAIKYKNSTQQNKK